jgi:hypothetical protein
VLGEEPVRAAAAVAALIARARPAATTIPRSRRWSAAWCRRWASSGTRRARPCTLAARELTDPALARLVLDAAPPTATADEVARGLAPERPLRNRGRPLTLGERKALARRPRGDALAELLRDPHPDVIRILLDNPQLTEREAVRIAAARPAVPAALALVAEHPRWSVRPMVRRALVLNRYTPIPIALRLVVTLGPADWADVIAAAELPAPVRAAAAARLEARGGEDGGEGADGEVEDRRGAEEEAETETEAEAESEAEAEPEPESDPDSDPDPDPDPDPEAESEEAERTLALLLDPPPHHDLLDVLVRGRRQLLGGLAVEGGLLRDLDLVVARGGALEVLDRRAEAMADLGQLAGAEDHQHDEQDDE